MLDPEVIEYAGRIPAAINAAGDEGKAILKRVLARHVPADLVDRPKQGFAVPVAQWIREPLRDWAESLLDERVLREEGVFDSGRIRSLWHEHRSGAYDWSHQLWGILMYQGWCLAMKEGRGAS